MDLYKELVVRSAFIAGSKSAGRVGRNNCPGRRTTRRGGQYRDSLASEPDEAMSRLASLCQNKPLMLFVDQFEELLTMCRDPGEQSDFARVLFALSNPSILSPRALVSNSLTLRTDHLARFESNAVLKRYTSDLLTRIMNVTCRAIGFDDIKRAIQKPADELACALFRRA